MTDDAKLMLEAISAELAAGAAHQRQIEAKALFRLLNYCPSEAAAPPVEQPPALVRPH